MKRNHRISKKIISVIMAVALLIGTVPMVAAVAVPDELKFGVVSDVHYYPESYSDFSDEFGEWAMQGNKQYINQRGILNSALALYKEKAQNGEIDMLIIPGDLSRNGEYLAHTDLAKILEKFEQEAGIPVLVINGNHDINNSKACSYIDGKTPVKNTTPEDFRKIYKNLGYDLAVSTFTPPQDEKAGMLSYAVEMGNYRIILIDGGKYSTDNTENRENEHETGGNYSKALLKWIHQECKTAREKGQTIIGVDHWSLVPHYESQDTILQGFTLDNWLQVGEGLADAGMHYVFTGHSHSNDVSKHINDNGEVLYDIQTDSLIEFPHFCRTVEFTNNPDGTVSLEYNNHEVDEVLPVTVRDTTATYAQPYRKTFSFNYVYKGDIAEYGKALADPMLKNLFVDITEKGGIVKYLDEMIGIEKLIFNYLGAFTPEVMSFINDLGAQIDEKYIANPDYTINIVNDIIDQLCDMQVSDYPNLALYDEYGLGDSSSKCTFGEVVLTLLVNMWQGDEEMTDLAMLDVVENFENGDLGKQVFDVLYDLVVNQLLKDEILSNLYVNVDKFFDNDMYGEAGGYVKAFVDALFAALNSDSDTNNDGKTSYLELIDGVLKVLDKTGVLEGGSVDAVLANLMEEYITESQYQAWGHTLAYLITDFCTDTDPVYKGDSNGLLEYKGKQQVPATEANYRLPSLISISLGNDTKTEMNISWYTKYSLTKADIKIVEADSGKNVATAIGLPDGVEVELTTTEKTREFPGVDLGVIGLFPYELKLQRHIAKISGLTPGKKYLFRVGNSTYGWWSKTGEFKTADGSDEVTFLHVTDSQGQNEKQYKVFADVLDTALEMYDDTDLVIHSGDMTDYGSNVKYWQYFFGCSENMIKNPMMAVAGNHEEMGDTPALLDNFVLPDSVEQDTSNGYYYSFDYNNIHFIMLNTNDTTSDGLGEAQLKWLKYDAARSNAKWKIVVLHKATYSNGSHYDDSEIKGMREQFASLMPELGIDMVFQGHDHVYLRTNAMNGNEIVDVETTETTFKSTTYQTKVDPDGTVYAITGASGCKNYIAKSTSETDKLFPRAERIVKTNLPIFAGIRISGDTLYYDAYSVNDGQTKKIDSFAIKKSKVLGDANSDGFVTTEDARMILSIAVGIRSVDSEMFKICDVDCDNHITTDDARLVLRKAAGLESY